ncbi:MAG TPA: hypothetical protein V6C89_20705 [Drouetiella sp.]
MYIPAKTAKSIVVYCSLVISFLPACADARRGTFISQKADDPGTTTPQSATQSDPSNGNASTHASPIQGEINTTGGSTSLQGESAKSGGRTTLQGENLKTGGGTTLHAGADTTLHVGAGNATPLHGGTSKTAPLQGHVSGSGTVLPAFKLRMSESQLKEAVAQYASDLKQFYLHVTDYHSSQVALKKQIGECTENEQQWQLKLQKDKLKLNSVVIATGVPNLPPPPATPPDIPPPRVCCARCLITGRCGAGHLGPNNTGSSGGVGSAGGLSQADKARLQQASQDLARTEGNLQIATQENSFTSQKAINEAEIEQSQQNLAEKFGRLQQEYDMLKIEKEALTGVRVQ